MFSQRQHCHRLSVGGDLGQRGRLLDRSNGSQLLKGIPGAPQEILIAQEDHPQGRQAMHVQHRRTGPLEEGDRHQLAHREQADQGLQQLREGSRHPHLVPGAQLQHQELRLSLQSHPRTVSLKEGGLSETDCMLLTASQDEPHLELHWWAAFFVTCVTFNLI